MSTEQTKAEFEKWFEGKKYHVVAKEIAWQAWQASRATLVVKLPHEVTHVTNKEYEAGRDDVISAVESAGITVRDEG